MNKLYNAIDPVVIDDDLLKNSIEDRNDPRDKNLQQVLSELEVMKLSYKRIRRIDNLSGLNKLTKLCLDNNDIETIENVSHLVHLKWLDLSFNKIKKIEGLNTLTKLTDLSLHSNQITVLENMDTLTQLTVLSIGNNKIPNLENLLYLRKFKNLSVLNLVGNPVTATGDYKNYLMARIKSLRYLDYRLVDENMIRQARDQYQEELRDLMVKEKEEEKEEEIARAREARTKLLKEANLQDFDNLLDEILKEDAEVPKLRQLHILNDTFNEYRERFQELSQVFINQMLEHHNVRNKERAQFDSASQKVQKMNDEKCLYLIEEFNGVKKMAVKDIKKATVRSDIVLKVEQMKNDNQKLYDDLMDCEMQLVEQYEEFIREFEARMSEQTGHNLETIRGYFSKVRDLETAFHDRVLTQVMQEMQKFSKNELDYEVSDEAKALLGDKEVLTNMVNTSHDIQSLLIESKEDDITKFESRYIEQTVNNLKNNEHQRNSARVSEIYAFIQMQSLSINAALEGNYDQI